ncbi:MAG: hypothetical protein AUH86_04700 [Acidobacteria bacterium 13_1_40CM_4_58_4]|nr:MAG: hypothetical protein AUH86_04700 [Acidobacteria bacterium 13_1_40CM_4_58_4]
MPSLTEWLDLLEFQQQNRLHQRAFIDRVAPRAVKRIGLVAARGAELLLSFPSNQSRQRPRANLAGDGWKPFERGETFLADRDPACVREQLIANSASSRKDQAHQCIACFRKPGSHATPRNFPSFAE